jgi:hypothetical protein
MKRAIVILVLFALFTQVLFAEINFRGELKGAVAIRGIFNMEDKNGDTTGGLRGDDGAYDQPWLYSYFAPYAMRARIRADINNESRTFGGFIRLNVLPYFLLSETKNYYENNEPPMGNIWWKPVEQFKATIGYFAASRGDMITSVYLADEIILPVAWWGRYYPDRNNSTWTNRLVHAWGWEEEAVGVSFELFDPGIRGLYIVATVPLLQEYRKYGLGETRKDGIIDLPSDPTIDARGGISNNANAWDILSQTGVRIVYNIRGFGEAVVSWDGGTNTLSRYSPTSSSKNIFGFDASFINAQLNLTAVSNLRLSAGVEIPLPVTSYYRGNQQDISRGGNFTPEDLEKANGSFKRQFPYGVDIRADYTLGNFAVRSAIAMYIGGYLDAPGWPQVNAEGGKINDPFEIGVSINPVYKFSKFQAGVVGEFKYVEYIDSNILTHPFTITGLHKDRGPWMAFNVIPYISTHLIAGTSAWVGFQVRSQPYTGFQDDDGSQWKHLFMWSIPLGISYTY